ncbi:MAG: ribonuclease HII [Pseudomonadota bacterium]|nr:ribonuclease HII [Pseudomonadota bacterium]
MRILGLDEAGRGSVLGPLVVGGFVWEGDDQAALRAAGADDSKALSHARRVEVRARLADMGRGVVRAIQATAIDDGNVNRLEEEAFLDLVRAEKPDRVYLDAPVHPAGIPKLRARLVAMSGVEDWVVECKADSTFPVVGAASIFAKVARDAAIAAIGVITVQDGHGPIGSGYPSDPVTRAFLSGRLATPDPLPAFVRTRWATLDILRQQALFGGAGPDPLRDR